MHPTTERVMIMIAEMGIISCDTGQAPIFIQKLIEQIKTVATIILHPASVIVDFHRVGTVIEGASVFHGEL